ncbi:hypothetical protein KKA24_02920 [Patescibacteria group bacterium]|nr:hypothetical protein [Patescibacteria group bacterium]
MRKLIYKLSKLFKFPLNPEKDYRVQNMLSEAKRMGGFKFDIKKHENGWTAECINFKGIITGGQNPKPTIAEVDEQIKDAIYTAFNIPSYLCRDNLISNPEYSKKLIYA